MASVIVLAQADSVANWVAAIGQVLGALGTLAAVGVALWLAQRSTGERWRNGVTGRPAQARLVIITVATRLANTQAIRVPLGVRGDHQSQ